jgi:hypothetical protein
VDRGDETSKGILQENPSYYGQAPTSVNGTAIKFLTTHTTGAPAGPLTSDEWRAAFDHLRRYGVRTAPVAQSPQPIPAGELYAYRVRCTGRYDWGRAVLVGPCGWEGATSRVSGDGSVPACPSCGGLTEPVAGGPRLRRIQ